MSDTERDELRLLALDLLDRAEPALRTLLAALRDRGERADHPPTCTWCPLCAAVGLLRGERPELAAAVVEHADGLVAALRAALATEPPQRDSQPDPEPQVQRVQQIDVRPADGQHRAGAGC